MTLINGSVAGPPASGAGDVAELLASARAGSGDSLGRLLSLYANYLKLIAGTQMDPRLRARVTPSDVVQDTFFEAHRDFAKFRGASPAEFIGWVRRILVNNVHRVVEQHLHADKRDLRREVSLEELGRRIDRSTANLDTLLAVRGDSPSTCAARHEQELLLADALAELAPDHRTVIELRHLQGLPFEDVAARMERSSGAVRMLWIRALQSLREKLHW